MTRDEFIEQHRHEIAGWVVDAATSQRTGADLAMSLRGLMRKVDTRLGLIYGQLAPADGTAAGPGTIPLRPAAGGR